MTIKILMRQTCLSFFNIEEFHRSCNFGYICGIFLDIKPTDVHTEIFAGPSWIFQIFFNNFQHYGKNAQMCNNLRTHCFNNKKKWLNFMICDLRPKKRVKYIWFPEIMIDALDQVLSKHQTISSPPVTKSVTEQWRYLNAYNDNNQWFKL